MPLDKIPRQDGSRPFQSYPGSRIAHILKNRISLAQNLPGQVRHLELNLQVTKSFEHQIRNQTKVITSCCFWGQKRIGTHRAPQACKFLQFA